ncbi:MAG: SDR family NAD(P)-dependent oxidoreductase, partial [Burkholderiales bacterium]
MRSASTWTTTSAWISPTSPTARTHLTTERTAMNHIDLKGRCAVVTGGAAGIGLAIAQRFAASGARVAIWDLDGRAAAAAAAALGDGHLGL